MFRGDFPVIKVKVIKVIKDFWLFKMSLKMSPCFQKKNLMDSDITQKNLDATQKNRGTGSSFCF